MKLRLTWLARRLGRMYVREVPHRVLALGQTLAQSRGFFDARKVPAFALAASFGRPWCSDKEPLTGRADLLSAAASILAGQLEVFGRTVNVDPDVLDWNLDPVSGCRIPDNFGLLIDFRHLGANIDIKFLWEVNRHLWWVTLAQAWVATNDRKWLDGLGKLIDGWLQQCPYPLGPNWSSPVEHGIRLVNWSLVWHLIGGANSPLFKGVKGEDLKSRWLKSVYQHIRFAADNYSLYSSANNHLLGEAAGIYVATHTWDLWDECRPLRAQAKKILEEQTLKQFTPDGVNEEQAMCYHKFSLHFLIASGLAGRAQGEEFSEPVWQRIEAAIVYLAAQTDCRGNPALYGDADEGAVFCLDPSPSFSHYHSLLALGARLFGRPVLQEKYELINKNPDVTCQWLAGLPLPSLELNSQSLLGTLPVRFDQGGYLIFGDKLHAKDEFRVLMDVGPLGSNKICGHGHADALSLTVSSQGVQLLCDPGTYCYNAEPEFRHFFRSTSAHNTLSVGGLDQSIYGGSFLWLRDVNVTLLEYKDESGVLLAHASHDGYTRLKDPVVHHRRVRLNRAARTLLVEDWVECRTPQFCSVTWHMAPGHSCVGSASEGWQIGTGGTVLRISIESDGQLETQLVCGATAPIQGWVSTEFYQRSPAFVLAASAVLTPGQVIRTKMQF